MKILIQTVGTGRNPGNPVWESLAQVVEEVQPEVLLQVCSELTHRETLPRFQQACQEQKVPLPQVCRTMVLADPDDVEQIILKLREEFEKLEQEFPGAEIAIDYTSGTKAMSAAVVAVGIGRRAKRLLYGVGSRDQGGRATKTEKVVSTSTDQAYADLELDALAKLFAKGQFLAVRDQALRLLATLTDESLISRTASLALVADAYHCWDRFQYKDAKNRLRYHKEVSKVKQFLTELKVTSPLESLGCEHAGWDAAALDEQKVFLNNCGSNKDGISPLVDLWANAARCCEQGRYDDALARLYRLMEFIGQMRYCKLVGKEFTAQNPTSKVPREIVDQHAPELAENLRWRESPNGNQETALGLNELIRLLAEANDPVGLAMRAVCQMEIPSNQGELGELLQKRNNSLLAHGTVPVDEATPKTLLDLSEEFLKQHATDLNIDFNERRRAATFAKCPWGNVEEIAAKS